MGYHQAHLKRLRLGGVAATVTAERPLPVHVDGDPSAPASRIEVVLRPHALRLVVPAAPTRSER